MCVPHHAFCIWAFSEYSKSITQMFPPGKQFSSCRSNHCVIWPSSSPCLRRRNPFQFKKRNVSQDLSLPSQGQENSTWLTEYCSFKFWEWKAAHKHVSHASARGLTLPIGGAAWWAPWQGQMTSPQQPQCQKELRVPQERSRYVLQTHKGEKTKWLCFLCFN